MRNKQTTIDLARSPFLRWAMKYIAGNPNCSKADLANKDSMCYARGRVPNRTIAYRYSALDRLIVCGYAMGNYSGGRYHFQLTELGLTKI